MYLTNQVFKNVHILNEKSKYQGILHFVFDKVVDHSVTCWNGIGWKNIG